MSTLAVTAVHFVTIPVRCALGRVSNIPTNTLLVYNVIDIGIIILVDKIVEYARKKQWEIPDLSVAIFAFTTRIIGVYVASIITEAWLLKTAILIHLVATLAGMVAFAVAMPEQQSIPLRG